MNDKRIVSFREKSYGLFLDLSDGGKVGVSPATGEILLDEGSGIEALNGVVLRADSFDRFPIEEVTSTEWRVSIEFGRNTKHVLGVTENFEAADRWVSLATNAILAKKAEQEPSILPLSRDGFIWHRADALSRAVQAVKLWFQPRPELTRVDHWAQDHSDAGKCCFLTGAAGAGKSSLAIAAATRFIEASQECNAERRVVFFSYASHERPSLKQWLCSHVFSSTDEIAAGTDQSLIDWLENSPTLLVLDGMDQNDNKNDSRKLDPFVFRLLSLGETNGLQHTKLLVSGRRSVSFRSGIGQIEVALGEMPIHSGLAMLRNRGLSGSEKSLTKLGGSLRWNALAIDLAGRFISEYGLTTSLAKTGLSLDHSHHLKLAASHITDQKNEKHLTLSELLGDFVQTLAKTDDIAFHVLGMLCQHSQLKWVSVSTLSDNVKDLCSASRLYGTLAQLLNVGLVTPRIVEESPKKKFHTSIPERFSKLAFSLRDQRMLTAVRSRSDVVVNKGKPRPRESRGA